MGVPGSAAFPASPGQRLLLARHATDPTGRAQSGSRCLRVLGPFDPGGFRSALHALVERHESLRTVFPDAAEQLVLPAMHVPIRVAAPCRSWNEALEQAPPQPFDPSTGPLLTVTIVPVTSGPLTPASVATAPTTAVPPPPDLLLVFRFHLLAADGWSMEVFLRDLSALYAAPDAALPDLPIQYADWSAWQAEQLTPSRRAELRRWWRDRLADTPLTLDLAQPQPPQPVRRGGMQHAVLGADIHAALEQAAKGWNRTTSAVLAAVFAVVLAARSRQHRFVLGIAAANREELETHDVLGFFVNLLPVRIETDGPGGFAEFVDRVAVEIAECYRHRDLPFEDIVAVLVPPRMTPPRAPVVQVNFAHHYAGSLGVLDLAGCRVVELPDPTGTGKFELTVRTQDEADGSVTLWAEYDGSTVDDTTGPDILAAYHRVLTAIAADPDSGIAELSKLAEAGY